jgi:beta-lactamase regulating signal transducer with metallopeptidase domain
LKPLNDRARQERRLLEALAHTSTEGVKVIVSDDPQPSCSSEAEVRLPASLFEPGNERELKLALVHELQHARDFIDGALVDFRTMEKRAERAEQNTALRLDDPDWWIDRSV